MFKQGSLCLFAALLLLTACAGTHLPEGNQASVSVNQIPYDISLNGTWRFVPASNAPENPQLISQRTDQWAELNVPENWYLAGYDLVGAGYYKRRFELNTLPKDGVVRLHFEAVDYAADVWVNEVWIGRHQGYFDAFSFDISAAVKPTAINDITVRVDSPEERPEDWSLRKRLIKGVLAHHDTRPGGAWSTSGQDANTGGIWGSVKVVVSRDIAIDRIDWVDTVDLTGITDTGASIATTDVGVFVHNTATNDRPLDLVISERNRQSGEIRTYRQRTTLLAGSNKLTTTLGSRSVDLWHPWESGPASLYDYTVHLEHDGQRLDSRKLSRGIRHVERDADSGEWRINGQRIFLRGTNYIPSQWLSEMSTQRFSHDIELMRRANINAVRVHAMVLPQRFYDLANEAGILVWQDFPLQWGYSDDAVFHAEAKRQLTRMIHQFGHHPAIIAWSMHNEPPWEASWMKYKYPDYDAEQNRALDAMLYSTALDLDRSRHVHEASLTAEHPWYGWYSGTWQDYAKPTNESLITEFGAQALPGLDTLSRIFPAAHLSPDNEESWARWGYRNFQRRESFEIAGIDPGRNVSELISNTQNYQARLIQFAAESYRRQRYAPVAGIFQFMFVEGWPSVNWGVLDYRRKPKPGYESLRLAYQPVLPSIEYSDDQMPPATPLEFGLWVINDLKQAFSHSHLEINLWRNGMLIQTDKRELDIAPDSAIQLDDWTSDGLTTGAYELRIRLDDSNGDVLGTNRFAFSVSK